MIRSMIKMACLLDEAGFVQEASALDGIISKLAEESSSESKEALDILKNMTPEDTLDLLIQLHGYWRGPGPVLETLSAFQASEHQPPPMGIESPIKSIPMDELLSDEDIGDEVTLAQIANELDKKGRYDLADELDQILKSVRGTNGRNPVKD